MQLKPGSIQELQMPSTDQRLTLLENSVIRLASSKVDVAGITDRNNLEDTRYLDLVATLQSVQSRLDAIETWVITHIQATGV